MKKLKYYFSLLLFLLMILALPLKADAKALDEILNYDITVDVNDDTTADILFNISWKVLDSDSEGPLNWVKIGIPNNNVESYEALTSNIKTLSKYSSGGYYMRVDFDRDYYAGEVVDFSFKIKQKYMYTYDPNNTYADYSYTPGWFDGIDVDNFTLRWNADKVDRFTPECLIEDGYLTWNKSLSPGEKFTVKITYPADAYPFEEIGQGNGTHDFSKNSLASNIGYVIGCIVGAIFVFLIIGLPIGLPIIIGIIAYNSSKGFTSGTEKKITRTMIEYYPSCPNCGAAREEGKETCAYCNTNMIKSKKVVKEEDVKNVDQRALKFKENGTFRYSDNPNQYVSVNVVNIPHVVRTSSRSSGHSSCVHSSCACACACACAGGGRAGCSTKDFYNTNLKMKHIRKVLDK